MKIFVTGASGFIGKALVVKMLEQGHHVIAAHSPSSTTDCSNSLSTQPQLNLLKLKLNLLNQQELVPYLSGCDCVIHLAHNSQDTVTEQLLFATRSNQTLLQACLEAQVKKFIYISSIFVYGDPPPSGVITEESPRLASVILHTSIKQAAEKLVLEAETGKTEVTVLQPGIVYGPGENGRTAQLLNQMKTAFIPLARYGTGYCNPIYIDDVVTAIIHTCEIPKLHRQSFIISNNEPISWKEFFSYHEFIMGEKTFINLPIDYLCESQASTPFLKGLVSKLLKKRKVMEASSAIAKAVYGKSICYLSPDEFRTFTAQPIFSNQKARDYLDFQPKIPLKTGIEITREWWHQQSLKIL